MREPEQLELFEPVPEQPKALDLKGAMVDTALAELLEHFSWEDIERAIERIKRDG